MVLSILDILGVAKSYVSGSRNSPVTSQLTSKVGQGSHAGPPNPEKCPGTCEEKNTSHQVNPSPFFHIFPAISTSIHFSMGDLQDPIHGGTVHYCTICLRPYFVGIFPSHPSSSPSPLMLINYHYSDLIC